MTKKKVREPLPRIHAPVVDSHAHLEPEQLGGVDGVDAVIARAFEAGIHGIVAIGAGFGAEAGRRAVALSRRHPGRICATVGLHPHQARMGDGAMLDEFRALCSAPEIVAVGEIGLDFHYDFSPREDQRRMLQAQVALAREVGLPIVIHDRETGGETFRILLEEGAFGGKGVLYHCFSGDVADLERLLAAGGYVSLPGVVTWSAVAQDVARAVPLDRLLVETDAPYLAPAPWRGHPNEPAFVLYTVQAIARLRGIPAEDVARATAENAQRFLGWRFTS